MVEETGVDYTACVPALPGSGQPDDLFAPGPPVPGHTARVLAQRAWAASIGTEGGLFVMMGRERATPGRT